MAKTRNIRWGGRCLGIIQEPEELLEKISALAEETRRWIHDFIDKEMVSRDENSD